MGVRVGMGCDEAKANHNVSMSKGDVRLRWGKSAATRKIQYVIK